MSDTEVLIGEDVPNLNGEHGLLATASENPRFGALYGRTCQLTTDVEMLDLLHRYFGLSQESQSFIQDTVLVSIDLEPAKYSKIREIGISTIDLRDVKKALASQAEPESLLPSVCNYNFRVQEKYRFDQPYIFGDTVNIEYEEILGFIQRVSRTGNPMDFSEDFRNVVIIGHSFYFDQKLFALNNISFLELDILDTCGLAQYIFRDKVGSERPEDFQLKSLIQHFEIQGDHFHVAGNDSNFTLKLLMMLVAMTSQDSTLSEEQQATIAALIKITHAPWPKFSWQSKRDQDLKMKGEVRNIRMTIKSENVDLLDEGNIMGIFDELG